MNDIDYLRENHNICVGDDVIVRERGFPYTQYSGSVYRIVNKPLNEHIRDQRNIMVDYFYIQFSKEIYHLLLKRGLDIIYQHQHVVLGNVIRDNFGKITQLFTQKMFSPETEIHLDQINSMLCWRIAYDIQKT
jgi:hypothetical protein